MPYCICLITGNEYLYVRSYQNQTACQQQMYKMNKSILLSFLFLLLVLRSNAQCDNVTDGGTIGPDQVFCEAFANPSLIESLSLPQGGSGDLEYIWIFTTQNPASPTVVWFPIAGSTGPQYDPTPIAQTTYYRRCARRTGCTDYIGESNIVAVIVDEACDNPCELFGITADVDNPDCGLNAAISFSLVAATFPVEYTINGENVEELPDSLPPGNYTLTAVDAEACTDTVTFEIQGLENSINIIAETGNAVCSQASGFINLSVTGTSGEITFLWNDGAVSEDRENLPAGLYTVTVSDNSACSKEASFAIDTDNGDLSIDILNLSDVSCNGGNDGLIDLALNGGTPPYFTLVNGQVGTNLSNLIADDYMIVVTDANGCFAEEIVTVNQAPAIMLSGLVTNPTCGLNNGIIELNISGGTANGAEDYQITWSVGNGMNLAPGLYSVTVTDLNNCEAVEAFSLADSGNDLSIDVIQIKPSSCGQNTGSISIEALGGTAPYTFQWSNGATEATLENLALGTYDLTLTDSQGCTAFPLNPFEIINDSEVNFIVNINSTTCGEANGSIEIFLQEGDFEVVWSDGLAPNSILRNDLAPGNYGITVTDEDLCSEEVSYTIESSEAFSVMISPVNTTCSGSNDGGITMGFVGGTPPFQYNLNGEDIEGLPGSLPADNYQLIVTDSLGCTALTEFVIGESEEIIYFAEFKEANCPGDAASIEILEITGGTGNYSVLWSDGSTELIRNNLEAGIYSFTITDDSGCTVTSELFTVVIPAAINVTAAGEIQNVSCVGETDGFIDISVTGGTAPYSYFWSTGAETEDLDNLGPDDYTVQITDAAGCSEVFLAVIAEPAPLLAEIEILPADCEMNNGSATILPTGGTQPYFYNWETGGTSATENDLAPGIYQVTLSDFGSCEIILEVNIEEKDCFGSESGEDFRFITVSGNASVETSQVSLNWETADEAMESYFILEHSIDNESYESITGLLPGEGLSTTTNSYNFTCENMATGTHYFRIRYVDPFGNLETSEHISAFLSPKNANDFRIYPNPSEGKVNLNFLSPATVNTRYKLINGQGMVLRSAEVPSGSVLIPLETQDLKSGIYYVEVSRNGLRKLAKRLLIL